ncbi:zinc finger protein 345-like [Thalassophryne amazonica]|uniref:zinc finger protein 345-like n=1 Tax=Thalassophryne amazonica TaxID=390379 RepID=UPI0014724768|nr:zinc finger protein 345-like [Thalassophryne amazonica]
MNQLRDSKLLNSEHSTMVSLKLKDYPEDAAGLLCPLLLIKEETLPEHQEWNLSVDQEDIKEEEKLWISQQGEQLQQLEEADLTKFGFTAVPVKSENNNEKPESSQLHQSRSDESTEAEPVGSSSSVHRTLTAEADGEDDGGPQPASNSGPNSHLQPHTSGRSSDSSGSDTDDSFDWEQARELVSCFNCQKNTNIVDSGNTDEKQPNCSKYGKASGHMNTGQKPFVCFECGRRFGLKSTLNRHMIIHTGQKAFVCSECGQRFGRKSTLNNHMIIHTGQKAFVCSECGQRFGLKSYLKTHMIIHTDMQPLLVIKEETLPEHQEWNLSVDQEDIKEEEKLWISQQGDQLQQLEEADLTKFGFTAVPVKSENDEQPESSQLYQSRSDESTEAEPVASSSSVHRTLTAEADGEDDGGPQPASNSGPNSHLQPDTSDRNSDSSGTETDDSYDWKQTRVLQSSFNCRENISIVHSGNTDEKQFKVSKYGKASGLDIRAP